MLKTISILAATLALSGCAAFTQLSSEVSSYGAWPAERKPASYAFERLPSQAQNPQHQQALENAARGAIETAGFTPASDPARAEYLIQPGARVSGNAAWYDDPMHWRGGYAGYGYLDRPFAMPGWGPGWGLGWGLGWGWYMPPPTFEREVSLLIRDRQTGQLLYETHATNLGTSPSIGALLPSMYQAAMKDFPATGPNPREVTIDLAPKKP